MVSACTGEVSGSYHGWNKGRSDKAFYVYSSLCVDQGWPARRTSGSALVDATLKKAMTFFNNSFFFNAIIELFFSLFDKFLFPIIQLYYISFS